MYPKISDALLDLFGIDFPMPVQSFGFFVALAFLTGSYFLSEGLKEKERKGIFKPTVKKVFVGEPAAIFELISSGFVGFIIGFKLIYLILDYSSFVDNPQDALLSLEGSLLGGIGGALIAAYAKYKEKDDLKLKTPKFVNQLVSSNQHAGNMVLIAALTGLLGAKVFHNLEDWENFTSDPVAAMISFSGLTFYGGLAGGAAGLIGYCKKNNLTIVHMFDVFAPVLLLSYGIGRIGCHVSGDGDWGIPNDAPMPDWLSFMPEWVWSYGYENNVLGWDLITEYAKDDYVSITGKAWPTPLYESVLNIIFFVIIWSIRNKIKIPGLIFSIYLIINGAERFFIEKIRINYNYDIFGYDITQAELISSVFVIAGITGLLFTQKARCQNKWI
ncbi:MAG: prolipoprotein diacylglyceryl transferase [Flavobacteriales bacterium]|nr:prolipoprotein diacylglyceryl transferase [Flavobacteriales bacterium]